MEKWHENSTRIKEFAYSGVFTELTEPYGSVKIEIEKITCETGMRVDGRGRYFSWQVHGKVCGGSWCGALWGGVPVSKAKQKYPDGKEMCFGGLGKYDIRERFKRHIAM